MKIQLLFVVILFLVKNAFACLHFSKDFKGSLTEGTQEFLVFHDGQNAHMVLRTELMAKKYPKEIAWVLPFPSLPSKYEEVEGPLFFELDQLFPEKKVDYASSKGMPSAAGFEGRGGVKIHQSVTVGNYQIHPIEILNEKSGEELNQWLTKNKFNSMPKDKQKRYIKKGATFLAIRMNLNRPSGRSLQSRPLHVVYKSENLSVPILFTHDNRVFDLKLYVFTQKEINTDFSGLYLDRIGSVPYKNEHLRPMIDSFIGGKVGWITYYNGKELNSSKKKLNLLTEDPTFLNQNL